MEMQVTRPVEEALRRVPGVNDVRSTTNRGSAEVSINFNWGLDMASATLQVSSAISQILPQLPLSTQLNVQRMDATVFPIIAYSLTSPTQSLIQLNDLAQYQLRPLAFLTGVTGAFFKALSITMAAGLFISFIITWLAAPMLAGKFLNQKDANQKEGGKLTEWVHARYQRLLGQLLKRRVL